MTLTDQEPRMAQNTTAMNSPMASLVPVPLVVALAEGVETPPPQHVLDVIRSLVEPRDLDAVTVEFVPLNSAAAAYADGVIGPAQKPLPLPPLRTAETNPLLPPPVLPAFALACSKDQPLRLLADHSARAWAMDWKLVSKFIRAAQRPDRAPPTQVAEAATRLISDQEARRLPADLQSLRRTCAVADVLATSYGNLWQREVSRTLAAVLMAACALMAHSYLYFSAFQTPIIHWLKWAMASAFLGSLLAAYANYRLRDPVKLQRRHIEFRSLAECARVLFYWRLAACNDDAALHLARWRVPNLTWVTRLLGRWSLATHPLAHPKHDWVHAHWIIPQANWLQERATASQKRLAPADKWASRLLWTIPFAAVIKILSGPVLKPWFEQLPGESLRLALNLPLWGIMCLPFIGGYMAARIRLFGWRDHPPRYQEQAELYAAVRHRLEAPTDAMDAHSALVALGSGAIAENAQWVRLQRARKLETPAA